MINITGIRYRNIYPQSGVSWSTYVRPNQTSGHCQFLFSGSSGNCVVFDLYNGKILSSDKRLLGSYKSGDNLFFSGNLSPSGADLYLNSIPLYLGLNIANVNQLFSGVYFKNLGQSSIGFNNLTIYGDNIPPYFYQPFYTFYKGQATIPIQLVNSGNYPITVYSGYSSYSAFPITGTNPLVNIPSGGTGYIYASNTNSIDLSSKTKSISISLYTNIGVIPMSVNISGLFTNTLSLINLGPTSNIIKNNVPNVYSLTYRNTAQTPVSVSLAYVSGYTGNVYSPIQVVQKYSQIVTGLISGSGIFSKFLQNPSTGTGTPTYYVQQYNTVLGRNETTTASGILSTASLYAPDSSVSQNISYTASGLGSIWSGKSCIINGSGIAYGIMCSGYVDYITGGILTGNVPLGTPMSQVYFNNLFTGYLTGAGASSSFVYTPNNSLVLNSALLPSQYSINYLSAIGSGYVTGTPTGSALVQSNVTGYFYNPVTTGLYFNKILSGIATGNNGFITTTVTGSVYLVDPIVVSSYSSIIDYAALTYINSDIFFTGNMASIAPSNISNVLIYSNPTGLIIGTSSYGYFNGAGTLIGSQTGTIVYAINNDGNVYNFTGANQFSVNTLTGSYNVSVAATGTGSWLATGNLTGQLYAYQGKRSFTGVWTFATGKNISKLNNVPTSGTSGNLYAQYLSSSIGINSNYVSQLSIGYNDLFSITNNSPYIDSAILNVSGKNFIAQGYDSGVSLYIQNNTGISSSINPALNCPPGYYWNNCWNYCIQCTGAWDMSACNCF